MQHKITSEINMRQHNTNPTPPQFQSARTIRPSLFLNEAEFHLPLISPQKRQVTDYQIIKQSLPKSQAVSPVFRKTQTEQDAEDNFQYVKSTVRKLKKQKLFIKDLHQSQQFLPQIEDHSENIANYSTPKTKFSTLNSIPIESKGLLSPFAKVGSLVVNQEHPTQLVDHRIPKEIQQLQQSPQLLPDQTINSNNMHQAPHHKKAVSFRNSIFVIDINNGQVSKDQISEIFKPLQHIQKQEIKEEEHEEVRKQKFRRTKIFI